MSNCNSCGGSMDPFEAEYYIGPECWQGWCHACAIHSPEYAVYLEAELAAAKVEAESKRKIAMSESYADQLSRVEMMAEDNGCTQDLSLRDKAALRAVLAELALMRRELAAAKRACRRE